MSRKASGDPHNSSSESSSSDEEKKNKQSIHSTSEYEYSDSSSSSDDEIRFVPTRFRNLKNVQIRNSEHSGVKMWAAGLHFGIKINAASGLNFML
jgi:hypothetical protein